MSRPTPAVKETSRIGIVGAGAAGVVCARDLKRRGWSRVTVLEAHSEPGGRTRSPTVFDEKTKLFHITEIGTQFVLEGPVLRELMDQTGLANDLEELPRAQYLELDEKAPYNPLFASRGSVSTRHRVIEMARYMREARRYPSLLRPGFERVEPALAVSVDAWFEAANFPFAREAMLPLAHVLLAGNATHRVPVAYLLKLESIRFRLPLWRNLALATQRVRQGNQEIWRRASRGLDVRYGQKVEGVFPEGDTVKVRTQREEFTFDRLIWTGTLPRLGELLSEQPAAERLLDGGRSHYRDVQYLRRAIMTYRVEGLPRKLMWFLPERMRRRESNVIYSLMSWAGTDSWYSFYPWLDDVGSVDILEKDIHALVKRLGGRVIERVCDPVVTDYLPFFEGPALESGAYDRIEREQGRNGIYVCGETLSGITLPAVTEYARQLVERFF